MPATTATGRLIHAEEVRSLVLVHETGQKAEIEGMAWEMLLSLCSLAAFAGSKRMRLGRFCADLREPIPACVARQTQLWHGEDA